MASVRQSLFLSNFATFANLFISLALVVVVSRWLDPAEIGAFLIAYAIVMLVEPLREFELKSFIIVAENLDRTKMKAVRSVAMTTAAGALLFSLAGSWILSVSYGSPTPGECLLILCLTFVMKPFSHPAEAILARGLRYGSLAGVKISGALVRSFVTLWLIAQGMGAEALAWGVVAEALAELLYLGLIDRDFRWGFPAFSGARPVWTFCMQLTVAQLSVRLAAALEPLLIGAFQGLAQTAYYNRGGRIVRTFRSGVEQGTVPIALSQFARANGDREAIKRSYLRAVSMLTGISWPVLGVFIILAEPVVTVLFGDNWSAAAGLGQILAVAAIIYAASALSQQVHAALGETSMMMRRDAMLAGLHIAILVPTAIISTSAVAWGVVAFTAISQFVHLHLLKRSIGLSISEKGRSVFKSGVVAVICAGAAWSVQNGLPSSFAAWQIISISGAIVIVSWVLAIAMVQHSLSAELVRMISRLRR